MDAMLVVLEPGFKESDWCCQEVGYALLERISLSGFEKTQLKVVIARVKAFEIAKPIAVTVGDDVPF
jgi:hypothetical protein